MPDRYLTPTGSHSTCSGVTADASAETIQRIAPNHPVFCILPSA
jgi:hypothetical protein